jgi:23S rRNA (adenine2503-C2)-methyltransferase
MKNSFEIAVIGGGPAGITAAVQATRLGVDVALFEREKLGGLIRCANLIENFPGFYGMGGAEAAEKFAKHARLNGVRVVGENVKSARLAPTGGGFELETKSGKWHAKAVIVATGTHPRKIRILGLKPKDIRYGIERPEKFLGRYVAIIGGGDAALDQALRLSKFAELVMVITRSKIKALLLLVKMCAVAGIEFREDEVVSGERVKGAYILHLKHGKYLADDVFAFAGREPNTELLDKRSVFSFQLSEKRESEIANRNVRAIERSEYRPRGNQESERVEGGRAPCGSSIETKIPGLYLAGDLIAGRRRQLAIAVGTGMEAALAAVEFVSGKHGSAAPTDGKNAGGIQMKILCSKGDPKLAVIHVAQFRNDKKYMAEFVESLSGSSAKDEKWVIIVSSQFGCPIGCQFCDAGDHFHGNLTKDELLAQIDHIVDAHYPDRRVPVKKFKVQFARMGEPMLNPAVLDALEEMRKRYDAPGLMPCISTIAPIGAEAQFERILEIKNKHYRGNFQMQFSIHSTDEKARDKLMPARKWALEQIAEYGKRFHGAGDRKVTLNFALSEQNSVDVEKIRAIFDPAHFAIKLTPVNPTFRASENRLVAEFGEYGMQMREKFKKAGFETIESIGELDENKIGSNCGQVLALWKKGQKN